MSVVAALVGSLRRAFCLRYSYYHTNHPPTIYHKQIPYAPAKQTFIRHYARMVKDNETVIE